MHTKTVGLDDMLETCPECGRKAITIKIHAFALRQECDSILCDWNQNIRVGRCT